ncbi:hypothetical protein [Mycoplasmopsis primatum]|uniref:hypothetical protein n=1 Tax=Mycoplasmopsis primatum TaxID=55604 RepID=UPI0004955C90|nr:hypothetical protein [Mycoplasmopsis primatum]
MAKSKEPSKIKINLGTIISLLIAFAFFSIPLLLNVFINVFSDGWMKTFITTTAYYVKTNFVNMDGTAKNGFINFYKGLKETFDSASSMNTGELIANIFAVVFSQMFLIMFIVWLIYVLIKYCIFLFFKGKAFIIYAIISIAVTVLLLLCFFLLYFGLSMTGDNLGIGSSSGFLKFLNKGIIWFIYGFTIGQLVIVIIAKITAKVKNRRNDAELEKTEQSYYI